MMNMRRSCQGLSVLAFVGLILSSAGVAEAISGVQFLFDATRTSVGFDPNSTDVFDGSPDYTILSRELAGPLGMGLDVEYTLLDCIALTETGACLNSIAQGASYFNIVTLTLETIPDSEDAENGILLFLAELIPIPESSPFYSVDDVFFDLEPTPTMFPTSAPFDEFQTIAFDDEGSTRYYLGFLFTETGQSVKLRYHVPDGMDLPFKTPAIGTLFSRNFVPEPSSALLLSLGLVGLQAFGKRR